MEHFGLEEFDDLGSYCMSHRLQPNIIGEVVQAYKNHRIPSFGSRIWPHKVDEQLLASPLRDSLFSHGWLVIFLAVWVVLQNSYNTFCTSTAIPGQ